MKIPTLQTIALSLWTLLTFSSLTAYAAVLVAVAVSPARTQVDCIATNTVSVRPGFTLSVRENSDALSPRITTITAKDGTFRSDKRDGVWYRLCELEGWASGNFLDIVPVTVAPTATLTATQPTPTRLVTNTPSKTATKPAQVVVVVGGTAIPCPLPCRLVITVP